MIDRRSVLLGATGLLAAITARAEEQTILVRELYNKDLSFSDTALALEGERVKVRGFMAPPLRAESRFFVLTGRPMSVCPFCETEAEWPDDILAIYTKRTVKVIPFNVRIETSGVLELGGHTDPDTGFVSRVRIADATYRRD